MRDVDAVEGNDLPRELEGAEVKVIALTEPEFEATWKPFTTFALRPPVLELTTSAPGATPRQVELRLPIAPATHVGWMCVAIVPVVLCRDTTTPARSPELVEL